MSERNISLYLQDIYSAIKKIGKYTKGLSIDQFKKSDKTVDAVIRNIEVMGEAVRNMPRQAKDKHSEIPWSKIIATRNKVIHEYFGVDSEILWKTVEEDIPKLKKQIKKLLESY